jgi:hypothetical protein
MSAWFVKIDSMSSNANVCGKDAILRNCAFSDSASRQTSLNTYVMSVVLHRLIAFGTSYPVSIESCGSYLN